MMAPPAPDFATYLRGLGVMDAEEAERLDQLAKSKYFLVRIDGLGERWRCKRCNGRHAHFTLFCLEKPFRGIENGLRAYWHNIGAGDLHTLSPKQQVRFREIGKVLRLAPKHVNLSTLHPQMAHNLGGDDADIDLGEYLLGSLEPISETKARILADLINMRARQIMVRL